MTTPILSTKLYIPPVRPELVSRPRLIERLNAGLDRKVTLISAAAGFGKTTLLSEWTQSVERPVAWLSLDRGDNDPNRFWRYVVATLRTVAPTVGETVQAALQPPHQPPLDTLVAALINDVAALSTPLVLVLDDYHVIESEPVHNSLNLLLDHAPPQLHTVITTRADPPLSLSRRRGRLELDEIRTADLCFTTGEAADFLNTCMGLDLSVEDVAALENRTEGWIVGLQMAALSLQGRADKHNFVAAFAGDDRYVGDYLVEEVLQSQPAHVKVFLLQTSILERLCAPLCDAVRFDVVESPVALYGTGATGQESSQVFLDHLEQANVFIIPLDNRRYWYRYHHLFADLLRRRLRQSVPVQELESLHLRASRWYESEGFIAEAVSHALAVPDPKHAAVLLEQHAPDIASRGEGIARGWLKSLPKDMIRSSPFLCLLYASYLDSVELAEQWLRDAERAWAASSKGKGEKACGRVAQARFFGWMASARAFLSFRRGDPLQEVVEFSRRALDSIPKDDLLYNLRARSNLFLVLGYTHWHLGDEKAADLAFAEARKVGEAVEHFSVSISAARSQAWIAYRSGRFRQAAAICREVLRSIVEPSEQAGHPLSGAGGLYVILGSILLEWNDLQGASRALDRGLDLIKLTRETLQQDGYIALARLEQAQGNVTRAFDLVEQVEQLEKKARAEPAVYRRPFGLSQAEQDPRLAFAARLTTKADSKAAALKIRFLLSQAERDSRYLNTAFHFAKEHQIKLEHEVQWKAEQFALARLLIAQHSDLQTLLRFLDRQFKGAEEKEQGWWMIETLILQAMVLQAQGNTEPALSALQRALLLAESEKHVRIFVDEGAPMARLLYQAAACGIAPDYAGKLLAAFAPGAKGDAGIQRPGLAARPLALVEPLTRRELEVLHLVAEGLSNREIGQRLVISPGTVKVHVSNIYDKLDVKKRTQAVAKARVLGILSST